MPNFTNKEHFSGGCIINKYKKKNNNKRGPGQIKTLVRALEFNIIKSLRFLKL